MPLGVAYPFGMRDIKITPFVSSVLETLATQIDLPAARTLTFTEAENYEELRGDDKVVTSRGMGASVDWDLEAGGISLVAYKAMAGGTLTESGTTPAMKSAYRKKVTDVRPFFRAEGQALSDNGGDVHVIIFRCRATGDIEGSFGDGEFYVTKMSGQGFPSQGEDNIDALYDIIYNETETAIVAPV